MGLSAPALSARTGYSVTPAKRIKRQNPRINRARTRSLRASRYARARRHSPLLAHSRHRFQGSLWGSRVRPVIAAPWDPADAFRHLADSQRKHQDWFLRSELKRIERLYDFREGFLLGRLPPERADRASSEIAPHVEPIRASSVYGENPAWKAEIVSRKRTDKGDPVPMPKDLSELASQLHADFEFAFSDDRITHISYDRGAYLRARNEISNAAPDEKKRDELWLCAEERLSIALEAAARAEVALRKKPNPIGFMSRIFNALTDWKNLSVRDRLLTSELLVALHCRVKRLGNTAQSLLGHLQAIDSVNRLIEKREYGSNVVEAFSEFFRSLDSGEGTISEATGIINILVPALNGFLDLSTDTLRLLTAVEHSVFFPQSGVSLLVRIIAWQDFLCREYRDRKDYLKLARAVMVFRKRWGSRIQGRIESSLYADGNAAVLMPALEFMAQVASQARDEKNPPTDWDWKLARQLANVLRGRTIPEKPAIDRLIRVLFPGNDVPN